VNNLNYLIEELELMIAEGKLSYIVTDSANNQSTHQLSLPEASWPTDRPSHFNPAMFSAPVVDGEPRAKSLIREIISSFRNFKHCCNINNDYNLNRNVRWIFEEFINTYKLHKNHLNLFDDFTNPGNTIVEVYQITSAEAFAREPQMATLITITPTQERVDTFASAGLYKRVALVAVPADIADSNVVEYAYAATQNLDTSWEDNPSLIALSTRNRSSSVGDVFVTDGRAEVVSGIGFKPLTMFFPRDPDEAKTQHLDSDGPGF
jgi:hypothetical protein